MADETVIEQAEPAPEVVADVTPPAPVVETPKPDKAIEGMQRRIDELTWRLRDTERRAQAPPEPLKAEPVVPKLEDFAYDEGKFQLAQTEYLRHETARLVAEELNKAKQTTQIEQRTQTFREREKAFAAKAPEYQAKVYGGDTVPISDAMAALITESEIGPEVAFYLANNLDTARQLYELPPIQAAREIGKLEAKLSAKPVAATVTPIVPKVSQAPPPPAKIEAEEPEVERDPEKMSDAQFAKWRRRQIAQRK